MNFVQAIKLSPVKITYKDVGFNSGFYHREPLEICIGKNLNENEQTETLLHEIGHAIHDENDCQCMNLINHTLAEYHAARFTMKYIKNSPALVKIFIVKINNELKRDCQSAHRTAARRIVKLKSWSKLQC